MTVDQKLVTSIRSAVPPTQVSSHWFVSGCRWRRGYAVGTRGEKKIGSDKPPGTTAGLASLHQRPGRHHY